MSSLMDTISVGVVLFFNICANKRRDAAGRDLILAAANGTTSYKGVTYTTTAEYITGLLQPGADGTSSKTIAGPVSCMPLLT